LILQSAIFDNSIASWPQSVYDFAIVFPARPRNVARMDIARLFTRHPASVGESYLQHLVTALIFGSRMLLGGLACFVHALLPFLFVRTASRCIAQLHERMVVNRAGLRRTLPRGERG
jgi:hypothetical protein